MLAKLQNAWNEACSQQKILEKTRLPDGSITFQKSVLKFMGKHLELTIKSVNNSIGIDVDRPETYFKRITVLDVQRNVAFPEKLSRFPATAEYIAMIRAMDPNYASHEAAVTARNVEHLNAIWSICADVWRQSLAATGFYNEGEIDKFIKYAENTKSRNSKMMPRIEAFFKVLESFARDITSKEYCDFNNTVTEQSALYNEVCELLNIKITNVHGDNKIPTMSVEKRTVLPETIRLPKFVRHAKDIIRNIYNTCGNSDVTMCYVLEGLARYFESVTGESVNYRIAELKAARDARRAKREKFKQMKAAEESDAIPATTIITAPVEKPMEKTNEFKKKPFKKFKKKVRKDQTSSTTEKEQVSYNPMGGNEFEQALANAKPLK